MKLIHRLFFLLVLFVFTFQGQAQIFGPSERVGRQFHSDLDLIEYESHIIDINGDGIDEIVVYYNINSDGRKVSIDNTVLNISPQSDLEAFGDLNNDGFIDFVDRALNVYVSDDTKTFPSEDFYNGSNIQDPASFIVGGPYIADISGDGNLDILSVERLLNSSPAVYYFNYHAGDGMGGFAAAVRQDFPAEFFPSRVQLEDFNRDNAIDLIVSNQINTSTPGISIYEGDQSGSFDFSSSLLEPNTLSGFAGGLGLRDIDNDGFNDFTFAFGNDTIYTILNNNNFPLQIIREQIDNAGVFTSIDSDNFPDLVSIQAGSNNFLRSIVFWNGNGDGTYTVNGFKRYFGFFDNGGGQQFKPLNKSNGNLPDLLLRDGNSYYLSLYDETKDVYDNLLTKYKLDSSEVTSGWENVLEDVNGDDLADLIYLSPSDSIKIYSNSLTNPGTFSLGQVFYGSENTWALELLDVDADNDMDIVIGSNSVDNQNLKIFRNDGMGNFAAPEAIIVNTVRNIAFDDINGDGNKDLVVSNLNGYTVLISNGSGSFNIPVYTVTLRNPDDLEIVDFDLDGNMDLVIQSSDDLFGMTGDGTGSFSDFDVNQDLENIGRDLYKFDVTGDGNDDIIGITTGNDINVIQSTVSTEFRRLFVRQSSVTSGINLSNSVSADFNGDGFIDLAFGDDELVFTALNNSNGTFTINTDQFSYERQNNYLESNHQLAEGDLNNDGKVDLFNTFVRSDFGVVFGFALINEFELAPTPAVQASGITVENITSREATIKWTPGDGKSLVLITAAFNDVPETIEPPAVNDFQAVSPNANYDSFAGSFRQPPGSGFNNARVIFDGEGDSVQIVNTPFNTTINVAIYNYNGDRSNRTYLVDGAPTTSFTTLKEQLEATVNQEDIIGFVYDPFLPDVDLNNAVSPDLDDLNVYDIISGNAEIDTSGQILLTGLGDVIYSINNPGDDRYLALQEVIDTITVEQGEQTIFFNLSATTFIQETDLQLPVYTSNDLPISYTIDSGPGSLRTSGDTTFYVWAGEGTVSITATQAGDNLVGAATPITRLSNVSKQDQTVTWQSMQFRLENDQPSQAKRIDFIDGQRIQFENDTIQFIATASAEVNYTVTAADGTSFPLLPVDAINSPDLFVFNQNTSIGDGLEVTVSAFSPGNDVYNSAPPVEVTFTIVKGKQLITWTPNFEGPVDLSTRFAYEPGYTLSFDQAVATSGLAVKYDTVSSSTAIFEIDGDSIRVSQAGTIMLRATQDGNDNWEPVQSQFEVTQGVTIGKGQQTIVFDPIPDLMVSTGSYFFKPTASSGNEVIVFRGNGNNADILIEEDSIILRSSGRAEISMFVSEDVNYARSTDIVLTFCVIPEKPTIIEIEDGNPNIFTLSVDERSQNEPWSFQWQLNGESTSSSSATNGFYTIDLFQSGIEGDYTVFMDNVSGCPDSEVSDPFTFTPAALGLDENKIMTYPNPVVNQLKIGVQTAGELQFDVFNTLGLKVISRKLKANERTVDVGGLAAGTYLLQLKGQGVDLIQRIIKK